MCLACIKVINKASCSFKEKNIIQFHKDWKKKKKTNRVGIMCTRCVLILHNLFPPTSEKYAKKKYTKGSNFIYTFYFFFHVYSIDETVFSFSFKNIYFKKPLICIRSICCFFYSSFHCQFTYYVSIFFKIHFVWVSIKKMLLQLGRR